jgi:hypothetical protein
MNRRILKKRCKRAMEILIAEHGYSLRDFSPSDGQEAVSAPHAMEKRSVWAAWLQPGPLKGTPMLWRRTSYECDEWDCDLPSEFLRDLIFWTHWRPSRAELAEMAA